jgi:hypothetical protein
MRRTSGSSRSAASRSARSLAHEVCVVCASGLADTVWHGLQKPLVLPLNPSSPSYDATKNLAYAFDLDKPARCWLATCLECNTPGRAAVTQKVHRS